MSLLLSNTPEYTVSEISCHLKRVIEDQFSWVRIRGEISGAKLSPKGHLYFSLKDNEALLQSICWKNNVSSLSLSPEDGLEVICKGRLSIYPSRSSYQFIVETMEVAGIGALMALLEKRKKLLADEGLFDSARKKSIPFLPRRIGVVTSPTGAVIRDILHRIADRFPLPVILWPVLVQGEGAKEQISEAIKGFNSLPPGHSCRPDVIIVARGGGSFEDLFVFNEEIIVRAVAASRIPVISAIGHETDNTLIDFVADRRAPTPTAAAEFAVPVRSELQQRLSILGNSLHIRLQHHFTLAVKQLQGVSRGMVHPLHTLSHRRNELFLRGSRLRHGLQASLQRASYRLDSCVSRMVSPLLPLQHSTEKLETISIRMGYSIRQGLAITQDRLHHTVRLLENLSYHQTLSRGYAIVTDAAGHLITSVKAANIQDNMQISFADGSVIVSPSASQ